MTNEQHALNLEQIIESIGRGINTEFAASLRAGAAALREASRWRPIAEAPKDKHGIEAIDSRTGLVRVVDYYKNPPCWVLQGASNECYPLDYFTHYRPIPDPPEGA